MLEEVNSTIPDSLLGHLLTWKERRRRAKACSVVQLREVLLARYPHGGGFAIRLRFLNHRDLPAEVRLLEIRAIIDGGHAGPPDLIKAKYPRTAAPMLIGANGLNETCIESAMLRELHANRDFAQGIYESFVRGDLRLKVSADWEFEYRGEPSVTQRGATFTYSTERQEFDETHQA